MLRDFFEKFLKLPDTRGTHVRELTLVQIVDRLIEFLQLLQAFGSDACLDDAAVVRLAFPGDVTTFLEAIEQTGHIRIAGNHVIADDAAGKAVRFGAAKNTKNIVLSAGKAVGFDELFGLLREAVGGFEDGDKESGLEGSREVARA